MTIRRTRSKRRRPVDLSMGHESRTIEFTGPAYELTPGGLPNPNDPIRYFWKGQEVYVTLKKVRGKVVRLLDNGWAVIRSNRSGAEYGIKLGK